MSREKDHLADALSRMSAADPDPTTARQDDEDEILSAPPPDPIVFAPRRSVQALAEDRALEARRTVIPVLLTCGVMLPSIGLLKWLGGADSAFAGWSVWIPILLTLLGLVLLALAALNMLQVREMLRRRRHAV